MINSSTTTATIYYYYYSTTLVKHLSVKINAYKKISINFKTVIRIIIIQFLCFAPQFLIAEIIMPKGIGRQICHKQEQQLRKCWAFEMYECCHLFYQML